MTSNSLNIIANSKLAGENSWKEEKKGEKTKKILFDLDHLS